MKFVQLSLTGFSKDIYNVYILKYDVGLSGYSLSNCMGTFHLNYLIVLDAITRMSAVETGNKPLGA